MSHRLSHRLPRRLAAVAAILAVTAAFVPSPGQTAPVWITDVTTLSTTLGPEYSLAMAPDGTATAVWVDTSAGRAVLMGAHRGLGGSWSKPVQVDPGSTTPDTEPAVAVDADGRAVVAWRDYLPDKTGSVIRTATSEGNRWLSSKALSPTTTHSHEPDVAVNARGDATVVWTQGAGFNLWTVRAAHRVDEGSWAVDAVTTDPAGVFFAKVSIDPVGRSVAVWKDQSGVMSADQVGERQWSVPTALSTTPSPNSPSVVTDASGRTVAVWQVPGGFEAVAREPRRTWGPAETVTVPLGPADFAWQPTLGVDASGGALVAWTVSHDGNRRATIHTAVRTDVGTWVVDDVASPENYNSGSAVAFGVGRTSALVWTGSSEQLTGNRRLYATTRAAGGEWAEATLLSDGAPSGPVLAVDAEGNGTVLWAEIDGSGTGLLRSRVFDGVRPSIERFHPTTLAKVGVPATYDGAASDALSIPRVSWTFDGAHKVIGGSVKRTFQSPGVRDVVFAAVDSVGNRTERTAVTVVAQRRAQVKDLAFGRRWVRTTGSRRRTARATFRLTAPAVLRAVLVDRSTGRTAARWTWSIDSGRRTITVSTRSRHLLPGRYELRLSTRNAYGRSGPARTVLLVRG